MKIKLYNNKRTGRIGVVLENQYIFQHCTGGLYEVTEEFFYAEVESILKLHGVEFEFIEKVKGK